MKLDDPELVKKPPVVPEAYCYKSLYCRNSFHGRCILASCECSCHTEDGKQLANQLRLAEQGADWNTKCYSATCNNRIGSKGNLFCDDCNNGLTPSRRSIIGFTGERS